MIACSIKRNRGLFYLLLFSQYLSAIKMLFTIGYTPAPTPTLLNCLLGAQRIQFIVRKKENNSDNLANQGTACFNFCTASIVWKI